VTKPVEPVDPSKKIGDGKSFIERMERAMPNSDPEIKKQFAATLEKYVGEGKEINEKRNEYKRNLGTSPVQSGGGAGPALGDIEKMMSGKIKKPSYKSGGVVISMASRRADGCCIRGKTKGKIV
jgi:hypothetical protein